MMRFATFVVVWMVFGIVYVIIELGLLGSSAIYPSTKNEYNFSNSLILIPMGCLFMGIIQGWLETTVFHKRLKDRALWIKISIKAVFYSILTILFLVGLALINQFLNANDGVSPMGIELSPGSFIKSFAFWSIVIYAGLGMTVAIIISEFAEYLGVEQFYKYLKGEYNRPNEEDRIFLFMDMKGSTTIAEQLGHVRYFELIKRSYEVMTNAILFHGGEIYQYVGDEVVLTWNTRTSRSFDQSIHCFEGITQSLIASKEAFIKEFGLAPEFKAGAHVGTVTSGEIGVLKRDIVYTGDVLNTASRIQGVCNQFSASLLVSKAIVDKCSFSESHFTLVDEMILRGKQEKVLVYSWKNN